MINIACYEWYFAFGSMMNKVSINNRDIYPEESKPAEILDFRLDFAGSSGMGLAVAEKGKSFHGVLHKVTRDEMKLLDSIESGYTRTKAKARLYDNSEVESSLYTDEKGIWIRENDLPPTERYIEIMVQGAEFYGVKQEYIDFLKAHKSRPRKKVEEYKFFEVPLGTPEMLFEEVQKGNGLDGNPFLMVVNDKVIMRTWPGEKPGNYQTILKNAGNYCELRMSKVLYEPKFGLPPLKIEDFTPEHKAFIEDMMYNMSQGGNPATSSIHEVIAILKK